MTTEPSYLFFWRPPGQSQLPQACLSQWAETPFEVAGVNYPTAEHWMMAEKARLFGDLEMEGRILAAPHPREVKALGRQVRGFSDARWCEAREGIVLTGSLAKFRQDPELREFLLGTGERVLVEASPWDRVWGIGLRAEQPAALDPAQWRGLNLLGQALMAARAQLQASR